MNCSPSKESLKFIIFIFNNSKKESQGVRELYFFCDDLIAAFHAIHSNVAVWYYRESA